MQEKEIVRVGGTKAIAVDVRVISATNANLEKAIQNGMFREDLYYRINVLPIIIPPLRDRKGDITFLTNYFIHKFNLEYGRKINLVSQEAISYLEMYRWPGNVRELENIISRAIIHMKFSDEKLELEHFPLLDTTLPKNEGSAAEENSQLDAGRSLDEVVDQVEKKYIQQTLEQCNYNKTKAAKVLNISVRSLYYKLEKHNIMS